MRLFVFSVFLLSVMCTAPEGETHTFDAEIKRILEIIINSLYQTKEIFLRELISNASDACDKSRILSLTNSEYYGSESLNVTISANRNANELIIQDSGVGMTRAEMITNLGTIAKSGTKSFLESLGSKAADSNLIGQFGLGFYSAFLVADKVTVISKKAGGEETQWVSSADDAQYVLSPSEGQISGTQGTKIILTMKAESDENDYFDTQKIKDLVLKYSSHIRYPIFILTEKSHTEEVPVEESEAKSEEDKQASTEDKQASTEDKLEVEEEGKEEKPKTKTVTTTSQEWERANSKESIMTRKPKDITEEEYHAQYKLISGDSDAPLHHIHTTVSGKYTEIRSVLFVPPKASYQAFSKDEPVNKKGERVYPVDLYQRRVLITTLDKLPRWASFIKGVVDVDNVPLNVSRETLQKHKCLEEIENTIVTKTLLMLEQMAKNETLYSTFYKEYSGHIMLGVLSEDKDDKRRKQLTHLLRFHTNVSGAKNFTSLADYCSRVKTNQTDIYYVTGSKFSEMKKLPYVEMVKKRGYEVVYVNDPYAEHGFQSMPTYTPPDSDKSFTLKNIAKGGLTFPDETEDDKQKIKDATETFKPLMDRLKDRFKQEVSEVKVSGLLDMSPLAVVANSFGWSAEMKRMMRENKSDPMSQFFASQKEILEINPNHIVIQTLLEKVKDLGKDEPLPAKLDTDITLLFNAAKLHSGYDLKDPSGFARMVEGMVRENYGMEPKPASEEPETPEDEEESGFPDFSSMMGGDSGSMGDMNMGDMNFDDMNMDSQSMHSESESQPVEKDEL